MNDLDYLGKIVHDKVTKFRGTVIAQTFYLFGGLPQVCVVPEEPADGAPSAGTWLPVDRVEEVVERSAGFECLGED